MLWTDAPCGICMEKKNTACDNLLLFPLRRAQTLSWASRSSPGVHLFSLRAKRPRQVWQWMWLCWHGRVKGFGKTVFCNLVTTARCAASPVVVAWENWILFFYLRPSPLKIYYSSKTCPKLHSAAMRLPGVCHQGWKEFFLFVPNMSPRPLPLSFGSTQAVLGDLCKNV